MTTEDQIELLLSILQFAAIIIGAAWTYYRFLREKPTSPRIEFDFDAMVYGPQNLNFMTVFSIRINNKGLIEHRFREIRVRILGLEKDADLNISSPHAGRVKFPIKILPSVNIVPEKFGYYFVRPGISQTFNYFTAVPENMEFIVVRITFKYEKIDEIHTTEKVVKISFSPQKKW
ncbi:hypothetical protein [Dyadobacter sp. CY347]|uniref:hypothetical protein n=1 Tax=Dyadobacter sp. CY347 TaxID=2909336 RepID=UPI001F3D73CC|nr:hypothetical protein [Dyadobacter sp. CY347]MCF2490255.1 hypothetical protein [Dyadobacter sp. CY347]